MLMFVGNLSYRKSAKFHGQTTAVTGDASKAVDGKPEPSCTQVAFSRGTLAQWSVDLGHQYKIININIQFPNLNCKFMVTIVVILQQKMIVYKITNPRTNICFIISRLWFRKNSYPFPS